MFDFVNTGRPMLFFTWDLEDYRDNSRGFYFDFEAEAPGPLLTTSGQVVGGVALLDDVSREYAARYRGSASDSPGSRTVAVPSGTIHRAVPMRGSETMDGAWVR